MQMVYMVFPTGIWCDWWLRSPLTVVYDNYLAWYVKSNSGLSFSNVNGSYGVISPDPYWGELTFLVYPSGDRGNYNGNSYVYRSYGHLTRQIIPNFIQKIIVVKIAVHGLRRRCVASFPFWLCRKRQRRQCRLLFLRAYSPSAVTNLDAFIATTTRDVGRTGNTSVYVYSYGVFTLRTLLEYLSGIHIQMVQLLGIMMDILIPTGVWVTIQVYFSYIVMI